MRPGEAKTGLVDGLSKENLKYDELVTVDPADDPLEATEPVSADEQAHYDDMYADFIDKLYGMGEKKIIQMVQTAPDTYAGVSQAAFTLLRGVYAEYQQREGEVPQAVMFGEGGMISTAVDEVFRLAQANGVKGADDINQYTGAQIDMMRRVGEYLESKQDDGAVEETQDLMADIELTYNPDAAAGPLDVESRKDLEALQYQDEVLAEQEMQQMEQGAPPPMPPGDPSQGGLV